MFSLFIYFNLIDFVSVKCLPLTPHTLVSNIPSPARASSCLKVNLGRELGEQLIALPHLLLQPLQVGVVLPGAPVLRHQLVSVVVQSSQDGLASGGAQLLELSQVPWPHHVDGGKDHVLVELALPLPPQVTGLLQLAAQAAKWQGVMVSMSI